jgi:alanine racemase
LRAARHVKLEGVCSHLASAEALDSEHARAQIEQFAEVVRTVGEAGFNPEICHLANSAALACRRESWWNMVRAGIALYGYQLPFAGPMEGTPAPPKVEPVLSWKTRVLALRDVPRGQPVGYNSTFVAPSDARLAVLAAGYADGLNRQLSNQGRVIVGACYAPIVGRVSMDLTIADVTRAGQVKVGDEVVLIGRSGELQIDAAEHARLCNTIAYEVLCDIAARVERRYV